MKPSFKHPSSLSKSLRFALVLGMIAPATFAGCTADANSEESATEDSLEEEGAYESSIETAPVFEADDSLSRPTLVDEIQVDETMQGQFSRRAKFLGYKVRPDAGDTLRFRLTPPIAGLFGPNFPSTGYRLALYLANRNGNPQGRALAVGTSTDNGQTVFLEYHANDPRHMVVIAYRGRLGSSTGAFNINYQVQEPIQRCGGIAGFRCDEGEVCIYAPEDQCGAADQLGTCQPKPDACGEIFAPVCGCNDRTFENECMAHAMGVSVLHDGPCEGPAPIDACGGIAGLQCGEGFFCNYAQDDLCGAADQLGRCEPKPEACGEIYAPVCGCDGRRYSNECMANALGVAVSPSGNCLR